jgi:1,4-alpha-glucan branching enzyme
MAGYLSLVLHAHLPFVRHPEHEHFLEESWFYEAITETYLPLLRMLEGWERDGSAGAIRADVEPDRCARCCSIRCCNRVTSGTSMR